MFNEQTVSEENAELRKKLAAVPGPWNDEPDREEFQHAGLDCLLQRSHFGNWCGYAAVKKGHKWFGKVPSTYCEGHDEDPDQLIDVHGGLTYAAACNGKICHKSDDEDAVWWFGFDCGHAHDLSPLLQFRGDRGSYKTISYVREQTKALASQLAAIV